MDNYVFRSWYLADEISGVDLPRKEEIQNACKLLNLPFTRKNAIGLIYGNSTNLREMVFLHSANMYHLI